MGSVRQGVVTISNRSGTPAINILPPDPYVPPDPCTVLHNPPTYLAGFASDTMTLAYAPRVAGSPASSIVLRYQDEAGANYTLRIPVKGTAYGRRRAPGRRDGLR